MTTENTISDATQTTVKAELHHALLHLLHVDKVPVNEILAVAHAELVNQIVSFFGGDFAIEVCQSAARRLAELPPGLEMDAAAAKAGAVMQ